jgi:TonB family protein
MASRLSRLPLPAAGAAWRPALANLEPALGAATTRIAPISAVRPDAVVDSGASARASLLQHLAPLPVSSPVPTARDALPAIFADLQLAPLSAPAEADAPTAVRIREPVYPPAAWADGIEGRVVIEFGLSADGHVLHPHVLDATPARIFDQAALDAVSGWRFALPSDAAPAGKYRQVVAFTMRRNRAQRTGGRAQGNDGESGRAACRVVTGTHICREADPSGFGVVSSRALRSQP